MTTTRVYSFPMSALARVGRFRPGEMKGVSFCLFIFVFREIPSCYILLYARRDTFIRRVEFWTRTGVFFLTFPHRTSQHTRASCGTSTLQMNHSGKHCNKRYFIGTRVHLAESDLSWCRQTLVSSINYTIQFGKRALTVIVCFYCGAKPKPRRNTTSRKAVKYTRITENAVGSLRVYNMGSVNQGLRAFVWRRRFFAGQNNDLTRQRVRPAAKWRFVFPVIRFGLAHDNTTSYCAPYVVNTVI